MTTVNTSMHYTHNTNNGHQMDIHADAKEKNIGVSSDTTFRENSASLTVGVSHDAGQYGQTNVSRNINTGTTHVSHQVPLAKGNAKSEIMFNQQQMGVKVSFSKEY